MVLSVRVEGIGSRAFDLAGRRLELSLAQSLLATPDAEGQTCVRDELLVDEDLGPLPPMDEDIGQLPRPGESLALQ